MQVYGKFHQGKSIGGMQLAKQIVGARGVGGLYVGLGASVVRQFLYTGTRMGGFQVLIDHFTVDGVPPSFLTKCGICVFSGAVGGIVGLPPDVALTRISIDDLEPSDKRRNYKNVFEAMFRIQKEEGPQALFRGLTPVVVRAVIVNASQMVSYYYFKELFLRLGTMSDNSACHIVCSMLAAGVTTVCVLPVDMAKTRMQNMRYVDGKPEYSGMMHVLSSVVKNEGFFGLWKGFMPLLIRNGPQFVVVFVVYEQCTQMYRKFAA
ncbi:hypothetical protein RN001_013025 [Aquatica leii]|uniref:Mitochondrial 2-oxoglutarate/malate carrier protein n=1 Tax=Aquatica leii TaxID=1421715 RepID=A0AAN7PZK0_9COLE|nr:hypothetical protein RN001_013025 [Aquatica leii]